MDEICHHRVRFEETKRSRWALMWSSFFINDIREGTGTYLAIFLLTMHHWSNTKIGLVMTIFGIASVIAQTPAGEYFDIVRHKRLTLICVAAVIGITSVLIPFFPSFAVVATLKAVMGVVAAFLAPGLAAITLGLVGPKFFTHQIARNTAYYHSGNVVISIVSGILAYHYTVAVIFYIVPFVSLGSIIALLCIKHEQIDHNLARGFVEKQGPRAKAASFRSLFHIKSVFTYTAAVTLYQLANQALLPTIGEVYARHNLKTAAIFLTVCIVVGQFFMVPVSLTVGKWADRWGHKKMFLIGFASLPIRAFLFSVSTDPIYLVAVQLFDGISGGVFGALYMVVLADITRGTGRFNVTQGMVSTAKGLGAAFSTTLAGLIADSYGYNAAFYTLGSVALLAFFIYLIFMPETLRAQE